MHRFERTEAGKLEPHLGLISNRVEAAGEHPDSVGDSAGDKGGSLRTAGWGHRLRFWDIRCCREVDGEVEVFHLGTG